MKFYTSDFGKKDFYIDKEDAIKDTLKKAPLSVRVDTLFGNGMNLDKEKIYNFIFNQDKYEVANEIKYYEEWINEIIVDETIIEYDTSDLFDIMYSYEGCESKLSELRKIGIYAYAVETVDEDWERIKKDEVSHTHYNNLDVSLTRYNNFDVYISLYHDQISIEIDDSEKVVDAAMCGVSKDDIVDTLCYLLSDI